MGNNDWIELNRDAETGIETIRAHFEGHAYDPHFHDSYLIGFTYSMLYLDPHWLERELRGLFEDAPGDCQPAFAKTLASEPELLAVIAEIPGAAEPRSAHRPPGRAGCVAGQAGATSGLAPAAR